MLRFDAKLFYLSSVLEALRLLPHLISAITDYTQSVQPVTRPRSTATRRRSIFAESTPVWIGCSPV